MIRPVRVAAPVEYPVSILEAADHCRVTNDLEASQLEGFIAAATAHLDGYAGILGRCLITQTWRQDFNDWTDVRLPFTDIKSPSIIWRNALGVSSPVAGADFYVEENHLGAHVRFVSGWSAPSLPMTGAAPVSVTFTAGYGGAEDVPRSIRQAILLMVGHWYSNREAVTDGALTAMPLSVDALITPHRLML